jgi:hypothetical protein
VELVSNASAAQPDIRRKTTTGSEPLNSTKPETKSHKKRLDPGTFLVLRVFSFSFIRIFRGSLMQTLDDAPHSRIYLNSGTGSIFRMWRRKQVPQRRKEISKDRESLNTFASLRLCGNLLFVAIELVGISN